MGGINKRAMKNRRHRINKSKAKAYDADKEAEELAVLAAAHREALQLRKEEQERLLSKVTVITDLADLTETVMGCRGTTAKNLKQVRLALRRGDKATQFRVAFTAFQENDELTHMHVDGWEFIKHGNVVRAVPPSLEETAAWLDSF